MSELTGVEQEQEAPDRREAATGPLLPRWFTKAFYIVFIPFCIYSAIHIGISFKIQDRLVGAIAVIKGDVARPPAPLDGPEGKQALADLRRNPVRALLYLNQELLQDEEKDERMARAMALRRAVEWGTISEQSEVIQRVLANMGDDGTLSVDFELDGQTQRVLVDLAAERRADPRLTYVEERITDVIEWLAEGTPGKPKGPEKRRLATLEAGYAKKVFLGTEREALEDLMAEWSQQPDGAQTQAAQQFQKMLNAELAALSPEGASLCAGEADRWERLFHSGMLHIAQAGRQIAEQIVEEGRFLDHPHIYQYADLLKHRSGEVREQVAQGLWLLRHSRFTIRFLSYFATKTAINPFMAVETLRLTREEHEREMRESNVRGMRASVELLGSVGVDYIQHRDAYAGQMKDSDGHVRRFIVGALTEVADEEDIADLVQKALAEMRQADLARPGGPLFAIGAVEGATERREGPPSPEVE